MAILGSTGSIGTSALDVIARFPGRFRVVALAAGQRVAELAAQVEQFRPELVAVATGEAAADLRGRLAHLDRPPAIVTGSAGLAAVAAHPDADAVLTAVVGIVGLQPTLAAVQAGKDILLANKETLVAAGELVMAEASRHGAAIIPVDSEHNAIFQCLAGQNRAAVRRLLLTGSGGPFRGRTAAELAGVTREQALRHPRWVMGPKITVDSATMMNKALELIEARWLFDLPLDQIEVVIHPESIVHSLVEFVDGSVIAQLGITDMRLPIQYALAYPERLPGYLPALDLVALGSLTFAAPDPSTFPSLNYGRTAATMGGTMPAVLNAANEVAVGRFLAGGIPFTGIFRILEAVMAAHRVIPGPNLAAILAADAEARRLAAAYPVP